MAVRLSHVCDRCAQQGQPDREASSVAISIDEVTGIVDLCDDHRAELDDLTELLTSYGRTEDGKAVRKRAKTGPKKPSSNPTPSGARTPTDVEKYGYPMCPIQGCGRGPYSSIGSWRAHLRVYHNTTEAELRGDVTHVCTTCDRGFGSLQGLAVHRKRRHPDAA